MKSKSAVPVLSVSPLVSSGASVQDDVVQCSRSLLEAARDWGFVYIKDHGVPEKLLKDLEVVSRDFFDLPLETKMKIQMLKGGKAWRGYFPPGGELTSGVPDSKEGVYFGSELSDDHPKVLKGVPLHGKNLWPHESVPGLENIVLDYMARMTELGHALMRGFAIGLGLDEQYFLRFFGNDPTILFRIFNYPKSVKKEGWGVGEHTDYGFLTILKTDDSSGLQILSPELEWIDAPPITGTFIINLGDQLEVATKGLLKATPHRVKIEREKDRLSWPFFFDPGWDVILDPVSPEESPIIKKWLADGGTNLRKPGKRWDGQDILVRTKSITHGEYLMSKVSKCFPQLFDKVC